MFHNSTAPIFLLTTIIDSTIKETIKWRNSSRRRAVACNLPVKNSVIHCLEAKPTFTPSIFDYNSPQSEWECLIATDQWCLRESPPNDSTKGNNLSHFSHHRKEKKKTNQSESRP
ncbi:hypothetical protein CEXT_411521 [Caerostris extrusa]|uniref:Uncharacterized protein n=1 Tax=Caerostris extrusa TaxID=172846 RepID=A0AAV4QUP4_CAEEX|nr:hypothetical protein CEXT_411521 [Caerostris extrusa]